MMKAKLFGKIAFVVIVSLLISNLLTVVGSSVIMQKIFVQYFTLSSDKILEEVSSDFKGLNVQIVALINAYRQNTALKQYFTSEVGTDERELFNLFYNIRTSLENIETTSRLQAIDIVTVGKNGRTFVYSGEPLGIKPIELKEHEMTQKSIEEPGRLIYQYNKKGIVKSNKNKSAIIGVKQLLDPYTPQSFGTIYVSIDEETLSHIYSGFTTEGNDIMLLDKEGTIVSSNVKELIGIKDTVLLNEAENLCGTNEMYSEVEIKEEKNIILSKYLPTYDMYLINLIHINRMLENFYEMRTVIFILCFIVISIAVVSVFLITRKITNPLTKLVVHIKKSKDGNFKKLKHIEGGYEVQELQVVYNTMIDEINVYVKTLVEEQHQRRKAELEALQMQINPHFLYNTLATIKYLSWRGDVQAVTTTINALISLLQNTINKGSEEIVLHKEIENLKNYVVINQARYGEGIEVQYYISQSCEVCKVPRLFLQPFLENAFFHAYQEKREGMIRVFVNKKGESLYCEILDDGDGISEENQKNIFKGREDREHFSGIGINNVNERIKLLYGEEYGVTITSVQGLGTTVIIELPYHLKS